MKILMRTNEDVVLLRVNGPTVIGRKDLGQFLFAMLSRRCSFTKLFANVLGNIWKSGVRHRGEASLSLLAGMDRVETCCRFVLQLARHRLQVSIMQEDARKVGQNETGVEQLDWYSYAAGLFSTCIHRASSASS